MRNTGKITAWRIAHSSTRKHIGANILHTDTFGWRFINLKKFQINNIRTSDLGIVVRFTVKCVQVSGRLRNCCLQTWPRDTAATATAATKFVCKCVRKVLIENCALCVCVNLLTMYCSTRASAFRVHREDGHWPITRNQIRIITQVQQQQQSAAGTTATCVAHVKDGCGCWWRVPS